MNKRPIAIRILVTFIATIVLSSLMLSSAQVFAAAEVQKDETVYGFLNPDGSVREVRIVNRLIAPEAGTVVDSGNYLSVRAMVSVPDAVQSPGRVAWDLRGLEGKDFYYEGVMESSLPLTTRASWQLDGKEVDASTLTGASGEVVFTLELTPDTNLQANLRDGFLAQIQIPLDLDKVKLSEAKGATRTVTGHTATLVWTLMPGEKGTFIWKGAVRDFASDPILLSLVKYETPASLDLGDLTDGVKKMETGANDLATGSGELADGLVKLKDGIASFSGGLGKLSRGVTDLSKGLTDYATGFDAFGKGVSDATGGIGRLTAGFGELKGSSARLLAGQEGLLAGLKETAAGHAKLVQLATVLLANPDPMVQQLAGGVIAEQKGIDQLVAGLAQQVDGFWQFNTGLAQTIDGLNQAASGAGALPAALTDMKAGLVKLEAGSKELSAGASASAKGAVKLDEETAPLPDGARKLADGQRELADGITTMREKTAALIPNASAAPSPVISFADGQSEISSLQYVIQLPGVQKPEPITKEGPRDVRLPWYGEFWKRVTGLFGQ